MSRLYLIILLVTSGLVAVGQNKDAKRYLTYGQAAMDDYDYLGAIQYLEKAIDADPEYALKEGTIYEQLAIANHRLNDYEAAMDWYDQVMDNWPDYKTDHILFQRALLFKSLGEYKRAKQLFHQFEPNEVKWKQRKAFELTACDSAMAAVRQDRVLIYHLSDSINSPDSEFGPRWINDTTIHFSYLKPRDERDFGTSSPKDYKARIAIARGKDTRWTYQHTLLKSADKTVHVANGGVNSNQQIMVHSYCPTLDQCEIRQSRWDGKKWGEPKAISTGQINVENGTSTHPFLTTIDKETWLLFASARPGGKGEMDLYASKLNSDSTWSSAKMLPSSSAWNDVTPSYDPAKQALYFSTALSYFGGYDVVKVDSGGLFGKTWSNMGLPINSRFNDLYYTPDTAQDRALLVSNREDSFSREEFPCCNDLYLVKQDTTQPMAPVSETITFKAEDLLPVKLYFHNDRPDEDSWDTISSLAYHQWYDKYMALKKTYVVENANTGNTLEATKAVDDILSFWDDHLVKGWNDLDLFNEQLLILLKQGKRIQLVVKGYASPLAPTNYNVNLTLRRINSLEKFYAQYNGGDPFAKYLIKDESGHAKLEFVRAPFGEFTADQNISDDVENERESVYSAGAALERRIEIIEAREIMDDVNMPRIQVSRASHSFGVIPGDTVLTTSFELWNEGKATMILDSVEVGCGCTTPDFDFTSIAPGKSGTVNLAWDTHGITGFTKRSIYLYYNGLKEPFELHVTGEILREEE